MPTNKETFKSKMDALANSINTKAGTSGAKDLDELKTAVDSIVTGGGGTSYPALVGLAIGVYGSGIKVDVTHDASTPNYWCVDEDGNEFDGTNGAFQYRIRTSSTWGNWVTLSSGSTTINPGAGSHSIEIRFINTTNNKRFGTMYFEGIPDYINAIEVTANASGTSITPLLSTRNYPTYDSTWNIWGEGTSMYSGIIDFYKTSQGYSAACWYISGEED